jgi:hypothetical protein
MRCRVPICHCEEWSDEAIQLNRQEDSESTRSPRQPVGLPRNDNLAVLWVARNRNVGFPKEKGDLLTQIAFLKVCV